MSTSRWAIVIGTLFLTGSLFFAFGYLVGRSASPSPLVIEKNSK